MVPARQESREINATDIEHLGLLAAGGVLLLKGMMRGGPWGALYKLGGAALLYQGQKGYRRLYDAMGVALPETPTGVGKHNARAEYEVVIERPRDEIYRIWRNLENLPVFMENLVSVHEIDDRRSIWVAKGPAGLIVKWDAEIINDIENNLIAWQSLQGSGVRTAGSVHFDPIGDDATRVRVVLRYSPPGSGVGIWIAQATGRDPQREIEADLQRFKAIMEVGGAIGNSQPKVEMR